MAGFLSLYVSLFITYLMYCIFIGLFVFGINFYCNLRKVCIWLDEYTTISIIDIV